MEQLPESDDGRVSSIVRYIRSNDAHIAYQVVGSGPIDIVFLPGGWGQLELRWEEPNYALLLQRLASVGRLIHFDRRGTGLSDRLVVAPSLDDHIADLTAVISAVGAFRPVIFGTFDGAAAAVKYAASHPDLVDRLILYASFAKALHDDPASPGIALPEDLVMSATEERWGDPWLLDVAAPSRTSDSAFIEWWGRYQRASVSPRAALELISGIAAIDVRDILARVQARTLVLHRAGDRLVPIANGRFIATAIPNAELVELPGDDYMLYAGDVEAVVSSVEEFLGVGPVPAPAARTRRNGDLTRREREIAALVGQGLTNKQIASRLVVSERTVESHVSSILRKLRMSTRSQIAAWASSDV